MYHNDELKYVQLVLVLQCIQYKMAEDFCYDDDDCNLDLQSEEVLAAPAEPSLLPDRPDAGPTGLTHFKSQGEIS